MKNKKGFIQLNSARAEYSIGFTLIELLVVIAILSLLTAISLTVMANYRDKAKNSRIETLLVQVRYVAAMIAGEKNSYESICNAGEIDESADSALKVIKAEMFKINPVPATCFSSKEDYCVEATLVDGGYLCVDNSGLTREIQTSACDADMECQ